MAIVLLMALPLFAQSEGGDSVSTDPPRFPLPKEGEPVSPMQLGSPINQRDTVIYDA